MKPQTLLLDLIKRYPSLKPLRAPLEVGFHLLREGFQQSGKWLIAGNGGSASDADHISGEWLKAFMMKQPPADVPEELACHLQHALPTIPLANFIGLHTAFGNDCDPKWTFAQLTYALGRQGDGLLAISTSGNSENILNAVRVARAKRMKVLGLTGRSGGALKALCDVCVCAPEDETYKIQELHLPIYHCWCRMIEEHFFGSEKHPTKKQKKEETSLRLAVCPKKRTR